MKRSKFLTLAGATFGAAAIFVACQKSDLKPSSTNAATAVSSDNGTAAISLETRVADMTALMSREESEELVIFFSEDPAQTVETLYIAAGGSCPPVTTYEPSADVYPRRVTIDYGTGCTNAEGVTRSGKIIFTYLNNLYQVDGKQIISYDNYYIDGIKIEGVTKATNNGPQNNSEAGYRFLFKDRKLIYPNGDYIATDGHRRVLKFSDTPGFGFPNGNFQVMGEMSYKSLLDGVESSYKTNITQRLTYRENCNWIVKGIEVTTFADGKKSTFDWGPGICDNQATLTVRDGTVYTITLP